MAEAFTGPEKECGPTRRNSGARLAELPKSWCWDDFVCTRSFRSRSKAIRSITPSESPATALWKPHSSMAWALKSPLLQGCTVGFQLSQNDERLVAAHGKQKSRHRHRFGDDEARAVRRPQRACFVQLGQLNTPEEQQNCSATTNWPC